MDAASNCERLRCCHVAEANRVEHHSGERDLAGICPQPSIVPCGVAAKRRKFALLAASCLAPLSFGLSEPALAQCTPLDASGNASCTGTFNTNINYNTNNTPINLTLQAPVTVVSPGGDAVNAANTAPSPLPAGPGANIIITADGTTINNTANPGGNNQSGLRIQSSGDAIITATNTTIDLNGTQSDNAIWAIVIPNTTGTSHAASVTWSGPGITSSGQNSTGIQADNRGVGDARIDASGNISGSVGTSSGFTFLGLDAVASDTTSTVLGGRRDITGVVPGGAAGNASVIYRSGTINVQGNFAAGIFASADLGSATITTLAGTGITVSQQFSTDTLQPGVDAFSTSGTATATVSSTILINGSPTVPTTNYKSNPTGIRATSDLGMAATVTYSGPGITAHGGGGLGIVAVTGNGSATVTASGGPIIADGSNAVGILADSGTIRNKAQGRPVASTTGPVQVTVANVSTVGQFGTAISATGGSGGVTITIPSGGLIMGGWQPDVTSVGVTYGLPAAGVILGSSVGTATLTNDGTIGALSDRAVASPTPSFFPSPPSPTFPTSNNTSIINNGDGTITGFVQFVGGNNNIMNDGTFNLRHFADTNGDGVRDTVRVAVTDLGTGANNTFTNKGTLALLGALGATSLDSTGQYLPLGFTFNAMALGGPVQGQILGASMFTNAGTINLQANPVPGDVLLISGGHTPGSNGGGTFVSSGGRLLIDTVLNAGGTASQSDVLVLDNAVVGAGGATSISVHNTGGPGALTAPGNGILVVQALGTTAPGTFLLAGPVEAGAFSYMLFRGSVDASGPQNWYLRSTLNCSLAPDAPECMTPPPGGGGGGGGPLVPNFRPAAPLYTALSPLAAQYGFNVLGTLHERMGDPYAMVDPNGGVAALPQPMFFKAAPAAAPVTDSPAIWGRMLGEVGKRDTNNFFSAGPDYTWGLSGLQSGFDVWRRESRDGARDHAGLYAAIGGLSADVQRVFRDLGPTAGSVNMQAESVGGYWTHYGPGGWYIDAVTQGTWYDADARSVTGPGLHTNGLGWAGSLEGGYPFALSARLWLEPQAQLIYQRVRFDDGSDQVALVSFSDSDALQGRLGARLVKTWDIGASLQPRPLATWLRANLWHEFLNGGDTTLAGLNGANPFTFAAPLKGTWAEIGGGATGAIGRNTALFATTAYQHSVDGNHQYAWTGRAGVTFRW